MVKLQKRIRPSLKHLQKEDLFRLLMLFTANQRAATVLPPIVNKSKK